MVDRFEDLSISNDEDEDLILDVNQGQNEEQHLEHCLVGRFLTERPINFNVMRNRIASIWRPGRGVHITDLGSRVYLFQFFHGVDVKRVMDSGPWSFDNQPLILQQLKMGDIPTSVQLYTVAFWVQIHDLPVGYMAENTGKLLGNFIGQFLEYDVNNNSIAWRKYMRIRVLIDVRTPLKRYKKIRKAQGDTFIVNFKYERLNSFCYLCGILGHSEKFCEKLFSSPEGQLNREWGPWLKAAIRGTTDSEGEKWLRNEAGEFLGDKSGTTSVRGAQKSHNTIIADMTEIQDLNANHIQAQYMQFTKEIPQVSGSHKLNRAMLYPGDLLIENGREEKELEITEERKRRRGPQITQPRQKEMEFESHHTTAKAQMSLGLNDKSSDHFLVAGPGHQACQEQ